MIWVERAPIQLISTWETAPHAAADARHQTALAETSRIIFQQVQKYEKGTNRVSSSRMQQFANVLQVTPAFFFEGLHCTPQREDTQTREISNL